MDQTVNCPVCGTAGQEVGKFCEQCGSQVTPPDAAAPPPADATGPGSTQPAVDSTPTAPPDAAASTSGSPAQDDTTLRFIQLENGVFNHNHAFEVPVGAMLLVGRTDPHNGVFPEVDVTNWSKRVQTPEGALYTIHRKQCYITRNSEGQVWIRDYPDYAGDTLVSPMGSSQFQTISSLADQRQSDDEEGIMLQVGDRILMGQGEGMLIFQLIEE